MKHSHLPPFLGVLLLLTGCDRSHSITEESPSSSTQSQTAPVATAEESPRSADELLKSSKSKEPARAASPPKPLENKDADDASKDPAREPVPEKPPVSPPETVKVRGKEYPYCRTPNEEGCISRSGPTQAPVWK